MEHRVLFYNLTKLLRGPTDFDDFNYLKEYISDSRIIIKIHGAVQKDRKTAGIEYEI